MSSWWFVAGIIVAAWVGCGLGVIAAGLAIRGAAPELEAGPLVLELVPVYGNGATGALARLEPGPDAHEVPVPAGAVAFRVLVGRRAGIYAGDTTTVARESEPAPAFLRGRP